METEITVEYTPVYDDLYKSKNPIKALEGGSRSSKTWSIIQYLIFFVCLQRTGLRITVTREKLTWLKGTVLKDFEEITKRYEVDVTPEINPRRAEQEYIINGNEWSFIGLDEEQKLFGRKQDITWVNEAISDNVVTGFSASQFNQLEIRTNEMMIMDYNPKATVHWIYDKVLSRPDVDFIHSTLLKNPFLPEKIRSTIFGYEPTLENIAKGTSDESMWRIYGLGQRGDVKGLIFSKVQYVRDFPTCKWVVYGLDFGYSNDVTALVKLGLSEGKLYGQELIYETGLTNPDIVEHFKVLGITKSDEIVADSAEPKSIEEIKRMGYNIKGAVKGPGSVNYGLQALSQYPLCLTESSINWKAEQANYKWKVHANGQVLNEPIDAFNHCWDAARYGASHKIGKPTKAARFNF